jgi:hypothetical protein
MAPVDSSEFARFIVECITDGHTGEREGFAGPQTLTMIELMEQYLAARGGQRRIRRAPLPTAVQASLTAGNIPSANARLGTTTWSQWLHGRSQSPHPEGGFATLKPRDEASDCESDRVPVSSRRGIARLRRGRLRSRRSTLGGFCLLCEHFPPTPADVEMLNAHRKREYPDDHPRRQIGCLDPPHDVINCPITGGDDGLGRMRWDIRRDLPSTVVLKHLAEQAGPL